MKKLKNIISTILIYFHNSKEEHDDFDHHLQL